MLLQLLLCIQLEERRTIKQPLVVAAALTSTIADDYNRAKTTTKIELEEEEEEEELPIARARSSIHLPPKYIQIAAYRRHC